MYIKISPHEATTVPPAAALFYDKFSILDVLSCRNVKIVVVHSLQNSLQNSLQI